jgi:hypothetical protein
MRKQKEGCARIVVWDEFKIDLAYTMEATYNGFDTGLYKVSSKKDFFRINKKYVY